VPAEARRVLALGRALDGDVRQPHRLLELRHHPRPLPCLRWLRCGPRNVGKSMSACSRSNTPLLMNHFRL
jgi:hypothetical protein